MPDHSSITRLSRYFRFPAHTPLQLGVIGELAPESGFFRFGDHLTCFGRTTRADVHAHPDGSIPNLTSDVVYSGFAVGLPFDPGEIVYNLTHERYVASESNWLADSFVALARHAYYVARPMLPLGIRSQMQKFYLRNWQNLAFPSWPVDTTVQRLMKKLLWLAMRAAGQENVPFIWFWPEGAKGCAIMTHDVEEERGKSFCNATMDIDDEFNIPSSFQIVPERRYNVTPDFIRGFQARKFEVNVHDLNHDGRLFRHLEEFKRRAQKINRFAEQFGVAGFRSAVLYRNQEWFEHLNFEYDMSVPNVAHLDPQRGGCCTVMPYEVSGLVEIPVTTIQEHSMFHILNQYSLELWKRQIEMILAENGLISFIIHPDYIVEDRARSIYRDLLVEINRLRSEEDVWVAYPKQVNDWWRARAKMQIVFRDGEFAIVGPGSERAVLAEAVREGDQIVYKVAGRSIRGVNNGATPIYEQRLNQ